MIMWLLIPMFFVLLLLGVPIAFVLLVTALVGAVGMLDVNAQIIVQSLFNQLNSYTILAVPFFIVSGGIAARGGTAKSLINFFKHLLGWLPGGLAVATIATCAFFAAISGSSLATIIAVGSLMIPTLIDEGYPEGMAVGLINSAGSLGILIPPSIPMVTICVAMGRLRGTDVFCRIRPWHPAGYRLGSLCQRQMQTPTDCLYPQRRAQKGALYV